MKITALISDETILADAKRTVGVMSVEEVSRCFPGDIVVANDDGQPALTLVDAPVFGVVSGLLAGLAKLAQGRAQHSFNDFYGEFSISIKREGEAIEVLEEYSGQRLAAGTDDWMRSVQGLVDARVRG